MQTDTDISYDGAEDDQRIGICDSQRSMGSVQEGQWHVVMALDEKIMNILLAFLLVSL